MEPRVHDLYPANIAALDRSELEIAVQKRAQTVYLGGGVVLARVLTRYKMLLHTADRGFACHVMMDGFWESWLTQFFARTLKPGMHAFDIGANYGYYSLLFADMVSAAGCVAAVEPNPAAAALLRESVLLNGFSGHTVVIEAALGAAPEGTARLFVPRGEPKNAFISVGEEHFDGVVHSVALTSVDALVGRLGLADLIKIDAEGAEVDIVAGMGGLLRTAPPALVLEFNAARCADPAALLRSLLNVYGTVAYVDFQGTAKSVLPETVLTTKVGEDWLLYFAAPGA
jgi:FkbM family methyltransferase